MSEIWITFPDPQLKTRRAKKRLTSPLYLDYYARLLRPEGWINLKTDSKHLYAYTNEVIRHYGLPCEVSQPDIYGSAMPTKCFRSRRPTKNVSSKWDSRSPIHAWLGGRHDFPWFDWDGDDETEKDNEAERQLR